MQNRKMFMEYITGLGELHNKDLSSVVIDLYWKSLVPFTDEQCKEMFDRAIVEFKFFPKPAELIGLIKVDKKALAHQQAGYLVAMLRGVGYRNPEGWDKEPVTARLLAGRFKGIYERAKEDEIKWIEKDFIEAFNDTAENDQGLIPMTQNEAVVLLDTIKNKASKHWPER